MVGHTIDDDCSQKSVGHPTIVVIQLTYFFPVPTSTSLRTSCLFPSLFEADWL